MKKLYALIVPLCLVLGACTTAEEPPVDAFVPIGFSTQVEAVTKTSPVITEDGTGGGTTKLTKFWVTGLYGKSDNYTYVFENTEVSDTDENNVWDTETPGYWIPEQTYRFAAYSDGNQSLPTGSRDKDDETSGVSYVNGTFRIRDYEAGSRDLVVAEVKEQDADDFIQGFRNGNTPCVPLEFKHILSMLTFTFTNETNKEIEVTDIRFTVINKADFSNDSWTGVSEDNSTERKLHADPTLTVAASATATSDAAFIIPQENADVTVTFTVNIRDSYGDNGGSLVYSKRYTASLATGTQTVVSVDKDDNGKEISITNQWYIGYRYNYTATIPAGVMEGEDVTLTVFVKDWEEENTNVSWGGKDEDDDTGATTNP